jgi:hypothetical protein
MIPQSPTTRTWTLAEYLDRAEQKHLLQPDERGLAEALARAWYFVLYLREDFPGHFSHKSSAANALNIGISIVDDRRKGQILKPVGEEWRA